MSRRTLRRWAIAPFVLLAALLAFPVACIETVCRLPPRDISSENADTILVNDPGYRRPETDSYLSYPEWDIVYAYQDFAGVLRSGDEHRFDYFRSITGYWTSFCGANRIGTSRGGTDPDEKIMLYVIGWSFTAEMAIKGSYEDTVGRLFAWLRGPERSNEDVFALQVAEDYAMFLEQTPWYEYPFTEKLELLWHRVKFDRSHPLRAVERRIALTMEWGGKSLYADIIRLAAGFSPAELRIGSVVRGLDPADIEADRRITPVRKLGDGLTLIDTPRYAAFTEVIAGLAQRDRQLIEIAGNRNILITVLVPPDSSAAMLESSPVFVQPVQSRPGWRRVGLDVRVPELTGRIAALQAQGAMLEHVYDY